jgi:hypothetical protein
MGNTNFDTVVAALTGNVTGNITGQLTYAAVSRTTTSDGLTTGAIADAGMFQFVNVTSGGTSTILKLPTPTPGTIVMLGAAGTAYELRSSAPSTVGINGGTGASAESAIAADTTVFLFCDAATNWTAFSMIAGTTFGAVAAAA